MKKELEWHRDISEMTQDIGKLDIGGAVPWWNDTTVNRLCSNIAKLLL